MPSKPKTTYKVVRETSAPTTTWYPNAERYTYDQVIGTYPSFKEAKAVAGTNLSNEWEENEGEEMRVYTVKDVDGTGQPEARETTSTKAKDASSAKQTAKKATPKPKAKVTAKSAGTSKTAAMGRQSPARQTAKRGAGRLKK